MTIRSFCIITAGFVTASTQAISAEPKPTTVYLWPSKVAEFEDKPTEELSSNNKGGVTRIGKVFSPSITVYPTSPTDKPSPIILVCPGGSYSILAIDKEGTEIAEWINSKGITAIVLKYSVPKMRDEALKDIQRAMGIIRQNSKEWKIDDTKLGVIGFSAGGHLAARLCANYQTRSYEVIDEADKLSCRPNFCMLIYPAWLEPEKVTETHPTTFIVQTKDDSLVKTTIPYAEALKGKNVSSEFHLFDVGGHGYGLRPSDNPVSKWPELCERWLRVTIKP
ncbi:MAG: alpha/beta hydrolase [Akkermansiaceae bacterium]|jgi:acetyl esterase/lipase